MTEQKPSEFSKTLYKKLNPILGINSTVFSFGDDGNKLKIYILTTTDPIDNNVIYFSTLSLTELGPYHNNSEIIITGYQKYEELANVLTTAAFFIIKEEWKSQTGVVFETLVEQYYPDKNVKHLLFVEPYLWEDKLQDLSIGERRINFLLAIPITQAELEYKKTYGHDALENLLEEKNIDIFDIDRKSTL